MTPVDIGSGFNQALEEDENGSAWVIFPDVPIFQYPEFNGRFILPMILFAKLVSWFKPDWQRLNGRYVAASACALLCPISRPPVYRQKYP